MPDEPKYWAFISYSHQDAAWSDWLFKALETYRIPKRLVGRESRAGPIPPRLYPVFRDRDELPGSAELSANLVEALKASRYLVVICSPHAARSRWVDEEVRTFKALGREGRILALMVSGEPNATDKPDSGMLECFPSALRFRHVDGVATEERMEPIAADVRPGKETKPIALLRLVAGIIGVDFDELRQRERQRVVARRWRIGLASAAACIASTLAATWLWTDARIERDIENGRIAMMSREYSRAAPWLVSATRLQARLPFAPARPHLAVMLGLAMAQIERLERIESFPGMGTYAQDVDVKRMRVAQGLLDSKIVVASLGPAGGVRVYPIGQKVPNYVRFEASGESLVYMADEKDVYRLDLASGAASKIMETAKEAEAWGITHLGRALNMRHKDSREYLRIPDGKVLASIPSAWASRLDDLRIEDDKGERTLATERDGAGWNVLVIDLVSGGIARKIHVDFFPSAGRFDPEGKRIALVSGYADRFEELPYRATQVGTVGIWDLASGKPAWQTRYPGRFRDVYFSSDAKSLITSAAEHRVVLWDAAAGNPSAFIDDPDAKIRDAYFFPDDPTRALTLSWDAAPRVWDAGTGGLIAKLDGLHGFFAAVTPLPDGRVAAVRDHGPAGLLLWNLESKRGVKILAKHEAPVSLDTTWDNSRIFSTDRDGKAVVWDAASLSPVGTFGKKGETFALSADGRFYIATGKKTGRARIGQVDDGAVLADAQLENGLKIVAGWNAKDVVIATDEKEHVVAIDKALKVRQIAAYDKHVDGIDTTLAGDRIALQAGDRLRILDAASGKEVADFPRVSDTQGEDGVVTFSRSGDRLLAGQYFSGGWELVDLASRQAHRLRVDGTANSLGVQFLCDDRYVAVILDNARFQLHDGQNGEFLRTFEGARDGMNSIACDVDRGLLVGADRSGSLTLWRIEGGPPLAQAKICDGFNDIRWLPAIRSVVAASRDTRLYVMPLPIETRPPDALDAIIRAREQTTRP